MTITQAQPQQEPPQEQTPTRVRISIDDPEAFKAATALQSADPFLRVSNNRRRFMVLDSPSSSTDTMLATADVLVRDYGAQIVPDYQYEIDPAIFDMTTEVQNGFPSLDDVVARVNAESAWGQGYRGEGVAIAVVDTGIAGGRPEFPQNKRLGGWAPFNDDPWTDPRGHGTMCACIAAGTTIAQGAFDGVAPDAQIIACRTRFFDSELTSIFDYLSDLIDEIKIPIVVTNSYGVQAGEPPGQPPGTFLNALGDAIDKGIYVVFSAGNNHELVYGAPQGCEPTSIWGPHKSWRSVMTVATCDLDDNMWYYSSRGPGEFHNLDDDLYSRKPDVTAPTPRNGCIVYGDDIRVLTEGWGTSGACPQVAGLAALLLSVDPGLTQEGVFDAIRNSAEDIGHGYDCVGEGVIDCGAAVDAVEGNLVA